MKKRKTIILLLCLVLLLFLYLLFSHKPTKPGEITLDCEITEKACMLADDMDSLDVFIGEQPQEAMIIPICSEKVYYMIWEGHCNKFDEGSNLKIWEFLQSNTDVESGVIAALVIVKLEDNDLLNLLSIKRQDEVVLRNGDIYRVDKTYVEDGSVWIIPRGSEVVDGEFENVVVIPLTEVESINKTEINLADANCALGDFYLYKQRDINQAIKFYEESLRIDPKHMLTLENICNAYNAAGRFEDSLKIKKRERSD